MMDTNIVFDEISQRENNQLLSWKQPNYLVGTSLTEQLKKETPNTI